MAAGPGRMHGGVDRMLAGADRSALAVALGMRLRHAGIPVGITAMEDFVRGMAACPPTSMAPLYWVARVTLVRRSEDIELFDAVFAAVFVDARRSGTLSARSPSAAPQRTAQDVFVPVPAGNGMEEPGGGLPWSTPPPVARHVEPDPEAHPAAEVPERWASRLEAVADAPFGELEPASLALLDCWLAEAFRDWPTRRSRRMTAHHAGRRLALRASMVAARRTAFEPVCPVRVRPERRPRRVMMLCDVSESMRPQAAAYLHLMRALAKAVDAEVFGFATRLTRLTPVLARGSPEEAVELASAKVVDRFGGTRITASLETFLASPHGQRCRGAIVLVASDGWDSDPPERLAAAMGRLRRRAYRIVWMNPRAGAPGFTPTVGAMAAALPFCDRMLPADTIRSLATVIAAVAAA